MPSIIHQFEPADHGPKIILLDLQSTLSKNHRQMGHNPTPSRIRDEEEYKPYLVDWLRKVQQVGWEVHLFTVRSNDRRNATLESILAKTGWQPDKSWFKSAETGKAPTVKSVFLDRLIPEHSPSALHAFESNPDTRRMFTERGICCCPISKPDDLPCLSKFTDS